MSALLLMTNCRHHLPVAKLKLAEFPPDKIKDGLAMEAFSGLYYDGLNDQGEMIFWTHSDRGPNAESFKDHKTKLIHRPFVDPGYRPRWIKFTYNPRTQQIQYIDEILLALPNGEPLTGLPNLPAQKSRTGDETPVTLRNQKLNLDPMGIDPEGICKWGSYIWMGEEYGPSLLKFDLNGKLVKRFVPQGYFSRQREGIKEVLPEKLMTRKLNRGFEGIACAQDKLYVGLQSPLPTYGNNTIILEFDPIKEEVTKVLYYPLEKEADKLGDLVIFKNQLLVLEQNSETGPESFHRVFGVDISNLNHGAIVPKKPIIDLVKIGYDFADKVEGLAVTEAGELFFVNDNDFGLTGPIDPASHKAVIDNSKKSVLGHIQL